MIYYDLSMFISKLNNFIQQFYIGTYFIGSILQFIEK